MVPSEPNGLPTDDPVIDIGSDTTGTTINVDASRWDHQVLTEALRQQLRPIDGPLAVWIDHPDRSTSYPDGAVGLNPTVEERLDERLAELGLTYGRDLFRMERPLPLGQSTDVETRSFVVGQDEAAWVEVNNAAFAQHREQGGWTVEDVRERQAEDWFDPEGFRIYETDGRIAAYCWTKVHHDETPVVGEVYVIAVHPDYHGQGLGRALTLAGYAHLAERGVRRAMLYVDADNTAAVTLYGDIGLEVAVVRRLYTRDDERASEEVAAESAADG